MTHSRQTPLLALIDEACRLAGRLVGVMKAEAETLSGDESGISANIQDAKERFLAALGAVLDRLKENPADLGPEEGRAFQTLQILIGQISAAPLEGLIEAHPESAEYRYERAGNHFGQGRRSEARTDYLAVLELVPNHFGALNDLAILEMEAGRYHDARRLFLQAVEAHPRHSAGHLNLADFLLSQCDYPTAARHYREALGLQPEFNEAHQGLSLALAGLGDTAGADRHRELGFRGKAVTVWEHRGGGAAIPLLVLSSAYGGNMPIKHVLDRQIFRSTVILAEYYDASAPLPPHCLTVNLIGDADLCRAGLDIAERLLSGDRAPVINPPALVRRTGRLENAKRLKQLPGVVTPNVELLPKTALLAPGAEDLLAGYGIGFPLLLRSPGFHTGLHFVRVEEAGELYRAVSGLPGKDVLVMQMLDACNADGDSHKFRVMFVDGVLYPLHLAVSNHWKVHYFSAGMDTHPEYRALEEAFLADMPGILGEKAMAGLENICRTLALDYGGIDFALGRDGSVSLFETNATMAVHRPGEDAKWSYRKAATERILQAVQKMVFDRANAVAAERFTG